MWPLAMQGELQLEIGCVIIIMIPATGSGPAPAAAAAATAASPYFSTTGSGNLGISAKHCRAPRFSSLPLRSFIQ